MRVGTFCYDTSRGLGHLARDFYRHGVVTDVLVVEHPSVPSNRDWYEGAPRTRLGELDHGLLRDFCVGKDAMLFFETPFDWGVVEHCRRLGVRTYVVTMYEYTPEHHPVPHRYLCPSLLDVEYFPPDRSLYLPLPVDYPWRPRERALHYVHNGGYLGLRGREGTTLLIEAMAHVKSPLRLTIRVQENVPAEHQRMMAADPRIEYHAGTVPYEQLYADGDVCVAPQKFNGCSLPLQEACAAGLLMMTTDRFPMNAWLPREPLIPVREYRCVRTAMRFMEIDEAQLDPVVIARTMDAWYGCEVAAFSLRGKAWAEAHSWEVLKPLWLEALSR